MARRRGMRMRKRKGWGNGGRWIMWGGCGGMKNDR